MFCNKCGCKLTDYDVFCSNCGNPIKSNQNTNNTFSQANTQSGNPFLSQQNSNPFAQQNTPFPNSSNNGSYVSTKANLPNFFNSNQPSNGNLSQAIQNHEANLAAERNLNTYNHACELMNGDKEGFKEAIKLFNSIKFFKDSSNKINECQEAINSIELEEKYNKACNLIGDNIENCYQAVTYFIELKDYKDSRLKREECHKIIERLELDKKEKIYDNACDLMRGDKENYVIAIREFTELSNYKDSINKIIECKNAIKEIENEEKYQKACKLIKNNFDDCHSAFLLFSELPGYKDSETKKTECKEILDRLENEKKQKIYDNACILMQGDVKNYKKAKAEFEKITDFKDSEGKVKICNLAIENLILEKNQKIYDKACDLMNGNKESYESALKEFESIINFKNSADKINECKEAIKAIDNESKYKTASALICDNIDKCKEAVSIFKELDNYKDSKNKIEECNKIIDRINAEIEQKRIAEEKIKKEAFNKELRKYAFLAAIIITLVIAMFIVTNISNNLGKYKEAVAEAEKARLAAVAAEENAKKTQAEAEEKNKLAMAELEKKAKVLKEEAEKKAKQAVSEAEEKAKKAEENAKLAEEKAKYEQKIAAELLEKAKKYTGDNSEVLQMAAKAKEDQKRADRLLEDVKKEKEINENNQKLIMQLSEKNKAEEAKIETERKKLEAEKTELIALQEKVQKDKGEAEALFEKAVKEKEELDNLLEEAKITIAKAERDKKEAQKQLDEANEIIEKTEKDKIEAKKHLEEADEIMKKNRKKDNQSDIIIGYITAKSGVNLRKEPNTQSQKEGKLAYNTKITILNKNGPTQTIEGVYNNWYLVTNGDITGWCFGGFVKTDKINKDLSLTIEDNKVTKNTKIKNEYDLLMKNMVKCPAGSFMMGTPHSELLSYNTEKKYKAIMYQVEKQHIVTISKFFYIGKYEVTQKMYINVMESNPSFYTDDENKPVEQVSWNEAKEFCNKLNSKYNRFLPKGYKFDLPTEAQWEYACRAGTITALNNGYNLSSVTEKCTKLDEVAWYRMNCKETTHIVGQKKPNAWGIYDMHGNVSEWCSDYDGDYPSVCVADPTGPTSGTNRVLRGGSLADLPFSCRSAYRGYDRPEKRSLSNGFRLALIPVK